MRLNEHNQAILFNDRSQQSRSGDTSAELRSFNSRKSGNSKGKNAVALSSNLIANLTGGNEASDGEMAADKRDLECVFTPASTQEDGRRERMWNVKRILQKPLRVPPNSGEKW